jgi:hypothetical protein
MKPYKEVATEISDLITEKNKAYGNSFQMSCEVMKILYPDGIPCEKYRDALPMIRVIDKLFRIANQKEAFDENPWKDICGYAMLMVATDGT